MLRSQGHNRLARPLGQRFEASLRSLGFAPINFLLHVVEERDHIAETVLDVDITVRDGDEQDLEFFREGGEGQEDGEDVVDALGSGQALLGQGFLLHVLDRCR